MDARVNGTRLCYELAGTGPPVVLVHGLAADARMWDGQWAPFARRRRTVRYDLRGFGRSAPPDGAPYTDAADLKALLDHPGIAAAAVVGGSRGAPSPSTSP